MVYPSSFLDGLFFSSVGSYSNVVLLKWEERTPSLYRVLQTSISFPCGGKFVFQLSICTYTDPKANKKHAHKAVFDVSILECILVCVCVCMQNNQRQA